MIIVCKSCGTRFRLNSDLVRKDHIKVKCSKCGHIFDVFLQDQILNDAFLPHQAVLEEETLQSPPLRSGLVLGRQRKGKLKWFLILICISLGTIGGSLLVIKSRWINSLFRTPAIEKRVHRKGDFLNQISIQDNLQAFFLENTHAGQIFVVKGEIVNESSMPVSFVLVEGKLYSSDNRALRVQRSYCGNVLTRKELTEMEIADIQSVMMNREGRNLSNVHIPPKGKVPFMVVFHNLPEIELLNDYSVAVVSAEIDQSPKA